MANNVKKKFELYEPMRLWLEQYLRDKYRGASVKTIDTHSRALDTYLEQECIISQYPQTVGLDIQIDVLGLVKNKARTELVFIEAKKTQLNLHDLGQLWAYCKLCDPREAFLLSSVGLGSLNKILNNLGRTDLLGFGPGRQIKNMQIGRWDIIRKSIDYNTLIPKGVF